MSDVATGTAIPVIDMSTYLAGGDSRDVQAAIRHACEDVGFFQVTGHGVDPLLLTGVADAMTELVGLSDAELDELRSPTGHPFRGVSIKRDADGGINVLRLQENRFDDPHDAMANGVPPSYADYFHPNMWPTQITSFRPRWDACLAATRELGRNLMSLFALALDLPRHYFDAALELDVSTMSANYYPPQSILSAPGAPHVILGAHEDSGVLTILFQTGDYTGLQLRTTAGSWIDVPVVAGSFVINIGDLMARWTNGKWMSTTHRVVAATEAGKSRLSVPTFYLPAIDTVISPLESCISEDGPLYPPITPYEWEAEFFRKPSEYTELGEHPGRVRIEPVGP
jgi:isopenicillin N synthase-like dioxygenase